MSEGKKPREIILKHTGEFYAGNRTVKDFYRATVNLDTTRPITEKIINPQPDIVCVEKSAYLKAIEAMKFMSKAWCIRPMCKCMLCVTLKELGELV